MSSNPYPLPAKPFVTGTKRLLRDRTALRLRHGRQQFLVLQFIHLSVYSVLVDRLSATALALSGLANIVLLAYLIVNELKYTRSQVHPFLVYLLASLIRTGLCSIWVAAVLAGGHTEALRLGPVYVSKYLMQGHLLLFGGDWLIILAFSWWSASSSHKAVSTVNHYPSRRMAYHAIGLLLIGWSIKAMLWVGIPIDRLGHFSDLFVNYASPAAIYLLFINTRAFGKLSRAQYYGLLFLILGIELLFSLSSYMKSSTLVFLISIALCASYSSFQRKAQGRQPVTYKQLSAGVSVLLFVMLILFPYSQLRRSELHSGKASWGHENVASQMIRTFEGAIPGTEAFREIHKFPLGGFWKFFARQADTPACAWVVQYVGGNHHMKGTFLIDALWNLVPRVAWPEKPPYYPGRKVAVLLGQARTAESATTSTGVGGVASSLYLNYGWIGVVVGCLLNGIAFAVVTRPIVEHRHSNPLATMLFFATIYTSLTHFESALDGGISVFFYWIIVFLPMIYFSRYVYQEQAPRSPAFV